MNTLQHGINLFHKTVNLQLIITILVALVTQHAFHTVKPSTDTGEVRNLEDQWGIKQKSNKPPTAFLKMFISFHSKPA